VLKSAVKKYYIYPRRQNKLNEVDRVSSSSGKFPRRHKESVLSAVSVGFFLILVGVLFVLNPDLPQKIIEFARPESFELRTVTSSWNVSLPIPLHPRDHLLIYQTVEQFCLVWAVFHVAILALRFILNSKVRRMAEGLGDTVFWFGAAYLVQTLLVDKTQWFEFWAGILTLIGVSLIARGVFLAAAWKTHRV